MKFSIDHTVRYTYSRPVFLEPHEVRMQPRNCGYQQLLGYDIQVSPAPTGKAHCLDAEGNNVLVLWFHDQHENLSITLQAQVQTLRENPFDYLVRAEFQSLPLNYEKFTARSLHGLIQRVRGQHTDPVAEFASELASQSDHQLLPFLNALNQTIYSEFESLRREQGDPWEPAESLQQRKGSCRDVAWLFIDACRSQGIAGRFVSGYQEGDSQQDQRDLHAWAEVYVPGGGWRGYDPTHGLAVADRHVAIAASASYQNAASVVGSFRGTGATADMQPHISLHVSDDTRFQYQSQQQSG